MPDEDRKREPLAVVLPAKPVSEMTDEEIDALADALYDAAAERASPRIVPMPEADRTPEGDTRVAFDAPDDESDS